MRAKLRVIAVACVYGPRKRGHASFLALRESSERPLGVPDDKSSVDARCGIVRYGAPKRGEGRYGPLNENLRIPALYLLVVSCWTNGGFPDDVDIPFCVV